MPSYEFFNHQIDERKAAVINTNRKTSLMLLICVLLPVVLALVLLAVLESIGFISKAFCMILTVITACYGSFNVGRVWYRIKW